MAGGFRRASFWSQRVFHFFAEPAARAEQAEAHGDDGNREALGDFLGRVMHDVAKQAGLAQIRWELKNCVGQFAAHFAPGALLFRVGGMRCEQRCERFFGIAAWLLERKMFAVAPLAQCVDRSIAGDAREPGAKVVGVVFAISGKLVEARPRFEQRFLADVFGVGDVACDAACALKQRGDEGRHHFAESFAIAAACA